MPKHILNDLLWHLLFDILHLAQGTWGVCNVCNVCYLSYFLDMPHRLTSTLGTCLRTSRTSTLATSKHQKHQTTPSLRVLRVLWTLGHFLQNTNYNCRISRNKMQITTFTFCDRIDLSNSFLFLENWFVDFAPPWALHVFPRRALPRGAPGTGRKAPPPVQVWSIKHVRQVR